MLIRIKPKVRKNVNKKDEGAKQKSGSGFRDGAGFF
jgi:hypothetical protein